MNIQASQVTTEHTITIGRVDYPVLWVSTTDGVTMVGIANTPFVSSNFASFKATDMVSVKVTDCERCEWDIIPHDNCLYYPNWRSGHSRSHCTADACY